MLKSFSPFFFLLCFFKGHKVLCLPVFVFQKSLKKKNKNKIKVLEFLAEKRQKIRNVLRCNTTL
uniref:Hypothetical secreted peptide n=1 Tax=Glossina morsitans morsitans TaxID=37546 RepID=D3TSR2_GLOMM